MMNLNRYISLVVFGFLFLGMFSCGTVDKEADSMTIEELKKEIRKKNQEIREISQEVDILQEILEEKDPSLQKEVYNVTIDTLKRSNFEHFVSAQGQIRSNNEISISAELGGRILSLRVKEGDYVRKGSLIAVLDNEMLQAQIGEVRLQHTLAVDLYEKQKALWDQNIGSEVQYLQAKNNMENLEKKIEGLSINQAKANVYATASGIVSVVMLEEGELAGAGMPIIGLIDDNDLKVVAQVPEVYVKNLQVGNEVRVEFPLLDTFQYVKLNRVGSVINPANRTLEVEANIRSDKDKFIKPNMLAMVFIKDFARENILKLPSPLVQQEVSSRKYVFVAEKIDGVYKAVKKYVETGPYYNNQVLIESGLQEGDLIINLGARGMANGSHLNILSQNEAADLFSQAGIK